MKRHSIFPLALIAMASVAPTRVAARPAKRPKREKFQCANCRDTRRASCRLHDRASRRYKPYCSACPVPNCCKGVGWTACPRCGDEATRKKSDGIVATYAREHKGEGFFPWGENFFCAACEHYRFKAAATHKECHEFHAVAERAFSLFQRVFGEEGVEQLQWNEKAHFLILASRDQYHQFLDWYKDHRNIDPNRIDFLKRGKGARLITDRLQVIIRAQTGGGRENKKLILHRIAHGAGHLAIENHKVHGNTPDWLGEGWACRSEIEALGRPAVYCIQYVAGGHGKRPPHEWRRTVRDAIRKKRIPPFEKLFELKVGEMGIVEWSMSISLVSWLVERFPNKAARLVDALKAGKSSKEAFEAAFERDLAAIEKAWQRWARTH